MPGKAREIQQEQHYFDRAQEQLRRAVDESGDLPDAAADKAAAQALRKMSKQQRDRLDASTAVAVGRFDTETGDRFYVGRQRIRDELNEPLVISWHTPAAAPYYTASPANPRGLKSKRTYECDGNTIRDFAEVVYGRDGDKIDAALLRSLARGRDGTMRDIVATIQAAQYDLISAPLRQLLVIEGGPGTGKTAIMLHRVVWLLHNHPRELDAKDVLVVGPHPTFIRYIRQVLPTLGEFDVAVRHLAELAPPVARGRVEPAEVARLKGDARMVGLLARALDARIGTPEPAERLMIDGRFVTLPGADVTAALSAARSAAGGYAERRVLLRDRLTELVARRIGADPGRVPALEQLVDRLWPRLSATAFLRDLLGSRDRLLAAAGGELAADEVLRLHRRGADRPSQEVWTAADLPLLDEAEALIGGVEQRYRHVVVDEVQDLSPMQLRGVARRSATGSLTIVGDLAQATGAWAAENWAQITGHLPDRHPVAVAALRYGYRVPRQVYAFAARLLPVAAPAATPPEVVRDGPAEPGIHRVNLAERAGRAATVAIERADAGAFVGVVCPAQCRREMEDALNANAAQWSSAAQGELGASINLVSPREAKGLEFDAVVVVEPEAIVAEDERGHRMLYVAFTRATQTLDVVCFGDPLPLGTPRSRHDGDETPSDETERQVAPLAEYVASRIRATVPDRHWARVLALVRRDLDLPD